MLRWRGIRPVNPGRPVGLICGCWPCRRRGGPAGSGWHNSDVAVAASSLFWLRRGAPHCRAPAARARRAPRRPRRRGMARGRWRPRRRPSAGGGPVGGGRAGGLARLCARAAAPPALHGRCGGGGGGGGVGAPRERAPASAQPLLTLGSPRPGATVGLCPRPSRRATARAAAHGRGVRGRPSAPPPAPARPCCPRLPPAARPRLRARAARVQRAPRPARPSQRVTRVARRPVPCEATGRGARAVRGTTRGGEGGEGRGVEGTGGGAGGGARGVAREWRRGAMAVDGAGRRGRLEVGRMRGAVRWGGGVRAAVAAHGVPARPAGRRGRRGGLGTSPPARADAPPPACRPGLYPPRPGGGGATPRLAGLVAPPDPRP
jgi:hypothetical protein